MSRKDTRNFTGGFISKELKTNESRGRAVSVVQFKSKEPGKAAATSRSHA